MEPVRVKEALSLLDRVAFSLSEAKEMEAYNMQLRGS